MKRGKSRKIRERANLLEKKMRKKEERDIQRRKVDYRRKSHYKSRPDTEKSRRFSGSSDQQKLKQADWRAFEMQIL